MLAQTLSHVHNLSHRNTNGETTVAVAIVCACVGALIVIAARAPVIDFDDNGDAQDEI